VILRYTWLVNGADPGVAGVVLTDENFTVGDAVQCVSTPNDGIDPMGTGAFEAYCDQTTDGGGWTRIVNHDYSADTSGTSSTRRCGATSPAISTAAATRSATTRRRRSMTRTPTPVSFTVGAPGARSHVFSYVCGYVSTNPDDSNCPTSPGGAPPHGWIGPIYTCESGNATGGSPTGPWHPAVMFPTHWFQVPAGGPTTEDVEGRLMATHVSSNEELGVIERILFVR